MMARINQGLMRLIGCLAAALLGVALLIVGSCSWIWYRHTRLDPRCADDPEIRLHVGHSSYLIPANELIQTFPEKIAGLLKTEGRNKSRQWQTYCQEKGVIFSNLHSFSWLSPDLSNPDRKRFLTIHGPGSPLYQTRPAFSPLHLSDIEKISVGQMRDVPAQYVKQPLGGKYSLALDIIMKSGPRRTIQIDCRWSPKPPLSEKEMPWIDNCRPMIPLDDGNLLEIHTGGTTETKVNLIASDIEMVLDTVQAVTK